MAEVCFDCAALSVRREQQLSVADVTYYLCLCAYGQQLASGSRHGGRARLRQRALSYEPENTAARTLYRSLGFVETGERDGMELVARWEGAADSQG